MKQFLQNHVKNIGGWKTAKRLILFSVDDYGSIRAHSKEALNTLKLKGIVSNQRFDRLDTLESREDLALLFDTLNSVKDKNGSPACFSPYALASNIDFDSIRDSNYSKYVYEDVAVTYSKLSITQEEYKGAWELWQQGIEKGFLKPEFHGREHMNLSIFEELLSQNDADLRSLIDANSYITIPAHKRFPHGWSAAFAYRKEQEIGRFSEIITSGLEAFKRSYDLAPVCFTPPAQHFPPKLDSMILGWGLKAMDRPYRQTRKISETESKSFTHRQTQLENGLIHVVRNVVFEPTDDRGFNWVDHSMKQVEAAFRMNKPANISSHRVNFAGNIDPKNREKGLAALGLLLKRITAKWPDVEFISVRDLVSEIARN